MKRFSRTLFRDLLGVTVGSLITALGLTAFLIPNKIAAGGVSGLATILFYVFGFPVGVTMFIINLPLLLLCIKELGMHFGIKSLYGTFVISLFIDFIAVYITEPWTRDPLLASIYGGVVTGLGLGIVFRSQGTTGGTDLAAALINKFFKVSLGFSLLFIDGVVIVLAGIVFNLESALYALVAVYVTSRMIDLVQEGVAYTRAALIISDKFEVISSELLHKMNRGVTALQGRGGYTSIERDVLLCVVSQSEVTTLKSIVYSVDPDAFVIVANASEVLGEGFKKFS
ncbi:MAG: YitT family protein [Bacillota bacterium]|jgi:uncharacterized membrane-anchored protein YitT (DUF2179 family)